MEGRKKKEVRGKKTDLEMGLHPEQRLPKMVHVQTGKYPIYKVRI